MLKDPPKYLSFLILKLWVVLLLTSGKAYADDIDSLKSILGNQKGIARVYTLNELSWHYKGIDLDSSYYYAISALRASQSIASDSALGESYNSLGSVMEARGNFDSALYFHSKAMEIKKQLMDTLGMANSLNNLGILYDESGLYSKSLQNYFEALALYEHLKKDQSVAMVLQNIGIVYKKQNEFKSVLSYYNKALDIYKKLGSDFGITVLNGNIGSLHINLRQFDSVLFYSQKAIDGYEKLGYFRYVPYAQQNMAVAYDSLGQTDLAEKLYLQSLKNHQKYQNRYEEANVCISLANNYLKQGKYRNALQVSQQGLSIAEKVNANDFIVDLNLLIAKAFQALGAPSKSIQFFEQYISGKDSLYQKEKLKQIFELEAKYEADKKEQQIQLQQAQIAEQNAINRNNLIIIIGLSVFLVLAMVIILLIRSRSHKKEQLLKQQAALQLKEAQIEASIQSQEKERARFAQDLHDGFGQLISVLNLNLNSLDKAGSDAHQVYENSTEILDEMHKEIKSICFDLMPQTLIKHGLKLALSEFAQRITKSGQLSVITDFFGMDDRINELEEISLYRIVQEWVNNIMKYGKASTITLQLTREQDALTLLIEDDGPGFNRQLLESGKGNGWRNIQSRVNLIHGSLDLDTIEGRIGNTLIIDCQISGSSAPKTEKVQPQNLSDIS